MKNRLSPKVFTYTHEPSEWPHIDAYETADYFVFELDLPGCKTDDISLKICNNILTITGHRLPTENMDFCKYICMERQTKAFSRSFRIPVNIDVSSCFAVYNNGVLTIKMPKLHDRVIEIKIANKKRGI